MTEPTNASEYLLDPANCCCFSGHRVLQLASYGELLSRLAGAIRQAYADGCRHFVSGGALGFDLMASVTLLSLREQLPGVTLTIAVPCRNQDQYWPESAKRIYHRLMALADEVVMVSPQPYFDGCMQKRNQYMVAHADLCICYLEADRQGGTAQTVRMAEKKGCRVVNLAAADEWT